MRIITLASRNVFRNWHRTMVTTLAMAFACCIMIIFSTLMQGMVVGSERQAVILNQGDIQVHAKGYRDDPDIYTVIKNSNSILNKITATGYAATTRHYGFGLVASDDNSAGIKLNGINVKREQKVTEIHKHIMLGHWLDEKDLYGIVIGKKLARLLNVKIGAELVFIGQNSEGGMANELFKIKGILKSISTSIDSGSVFLNDYALIELLLLPKDAHEIVVMRSDRSTNLDFATSEIKTLAENNETLNWRQLMPVIARFLDSADINSFIMLIFTYIAVASVILNAMLMSVFERIHEFGIMKAIGVTPTQTVLLIYIETLFQTCIASVIGLGFGWWGSHYFETHGIDMSNMAGDFSFAGIALDPIWYSKITSSALLTPVFFLFVIAVISVIYPAIKVAKLRAVDAIHYQ